MNSDAFRIVVSAPSGEDAGPGRAAETFQNVLRHGLLEHLRSGSDCFRSADLRIQLTQIRFDRHRHYAALTLEGLLNDTPLTPSTFEVERLIEADLDTLAAAAVGAASAAVVNAATAAKAPQEHPPQAVTPHPASLEQRLLFQLWEHLDRSAGRAVSESAVLWSKIMRLRWIAAAVTLIGSTGLALVRHGVQTDALIFAAMMAALAGGLGFAIVHCYALISMPADFFQKETAGKMALRMAGVPSVSALRGVAIFGAVLMVAALLGVLALCSKVIWL